MTHLILTLGLLISCSVFGVSDNATTYLEHQFQAIQTIMTSKATTANRIAQIEALVSDTFDFPLIAKLSIGATHWKTMSASQKQVFSTTFERYLLKTYLAGISKIPWDTITFPDVNASQQSNKRAIITINAPLPDSDPVTMRFKLYKKQTGWRIYDLEFEGVSIIRSFRAQFSATLKDHDISVVIDQLNAKL